MHFISPQTAWLQGQAEGLNLVNLLASQWGDLYTNVGDLSGGLSGVSREDTLVWVGTENRQHLLGHMSLLGVRGAPVFPMTTGRARRRATSATPPGRRSPSGRTRPAARTGLVVIPHFPNPYCEVAADIVQGKIDAVEINMQRLLPRRSASGTATSTAATASPPSAGTDKMGAWMPVGAIRTYARLSEAGRGPVHVRRLGGGRARRAHLHHHRAR